MTGMLIRPLGACDIPAIESLAHEAEAEGFRFLGRFLADFAAGLIRFNTPVEFFHGVELNAGLVAMGGVTPDPYVRDVIVGRLRHVYVSPEIRRSGIGRELVQTLEARARRTYRRLRLRTDTPGAAAFYERLGYDAIEHRTATHERALIACT